MTQEELTKIEIRLRAMQAAIAWYCCHHPGESTGGGIGSEGPVLSEQDEKTLMELRNKFIHQAVTVPSPDL